jgi:DNA polymerase
MGWRKFKATCKKQGNPIDDDIAEKGVNGWRARNYRVCELWRALEDAARSAIEAPGKVFAAGPVSFRIKGRWLQMRLPSGRILWYNRPHMAPTTADVEACVEGEEVPYYRWKIHYWGVNSYTKQWAVESTWGGKLLENAVQGFCHDFLAGAILRLEGAGYPVVLTVHDEAISEPDLNFGSKDQFAALMSVVPDWAPGFPLKADCGEALR